MTEPAATTCQACGFRNHGGDQFCGSCGAFLEWVGERVDPPDAPAGVAVPTEIAPPSATVGPVAPATPDGGTAGHQRPGDLIRCVACGIANPATRTFCQSCGARLGRITADRRTEAFEAPPADGRTTVIPRWIIPVVALGLVSGALVVGAALMLRQDVNLALDRSTTSSLSLPSSPSSAAVDGVSDTDLVWSSGGDAPQWIEIDLGEPSTITGLRLVVAQSPAGQTRHEVLGRAVAAGGAIVLHEFAGRTAELDELTATFAEPIHEIRYVRIQTVASPSWVAWREIEILGRPD